jgi:hypothetical protein
MREVVADAGVRSLFPEALPRYRDTRSLSV